MKIIKFLIIITIIPLSFVLPAQKIWSLDSCIEQALRNSYQVNKNLLQLESERITSSTTKMGTLPYLSLSVNQNFDFGRSTTASAVIVDDNQSTSSLGLNFRMPLFNGLKTYHQMASDKLNMQVIEQEIDRTKENITLTVTGYYLEILLYKEMLQTAEKQVAITRELLKTTQALVNNGKVSKSDLYNAESTLSNDLLEVTNMTNQLRISKLNLSQLMNLETSSQFEIQEPEELLSNVEAYMAQEVNINDITSNSLQNRPVIKAAELLLSKAERDIKVAQSDYYPTLSLGASYSTGYYYSFQESAFYSNLPFATQLGNNSREMVYLSLDFPIFDQLSTYHNVKRQKLYLKQQALELEEAKRNLIKEVEQAYTEALSARDQYNAAQIATKASQTAFEFEEVKFSEGASTQYQFNEAKNKYISALSSEIQAKYRFLFKREILLFYNGK